MEPIDLGDGLILRCATPADTALADFNALIFGDGKEPDMRLHAWVLDILSGTHPTFAPNDFMMVMNGDQIVSSLCLISQTWTYDGIPFGVGRPELVATHPEYRKRGLIRKQMEVAHRWSAERGHKMQAITGIPYYYRQFGYEMALSLHGGRAGYLPHVPKLKEDETEPYTIRPATEDDIPLLVKLSAQGEKRQPIASPLDAKMWQYALTGRSVDSEVYSPTCIIQTPQGEAVGYLVHDRNPKATMIHVIEYELVAGVSWFAVTPTVIRYLMSAGEQIAGKPLLGFGFALVDHHPAIEIMRERLPEVYRPYAWYIRIPDLGDFLRHIAPALDERLARSAMVGYSGAVKWGFYRHGLRLVWENGKLVAVEDWQPMPDDRGSVLFPDLTFLQLLMGYRSIDDLRNAFPDIRSDVTLMPLLRALFPQRQSTVWGIG